MYNTANIYLLPLEYCFLTEAKNRLWNYKNWGGGGRDYHTINYAKIGLAELEHNATKDNACNKWCNKL